MKVIHIVENLDKGAVENWLVNVFIESKNLRPHWEWTFYCILGQPGRLDSAVRAAGGSILYSPYTISQKWRFLNSLRKVLKTNRYDILHSHHDYLSGFYLLSTIGIGFKMKILQIHNTDKSLPVGNKKFEKLLLRVFKTLAIHFSDLIVGISEVTLKQFIDHSFIKKRATILYYGIDMMAFSQPIDSNSFRTEMGIPIAAKMILFSGRLNSYKNPLFVIEILKEIVKSNKSFYAIFVGQGDLSKDIVLLARKYGIEDHIRLTGFRNDLANIMRSCDVFVFPRVEEPKEGLGLVVVESQAAGLPMVLSYGIVEDAIEIKELATFISLKDNVAEWATIIINTKKTLLPSLALQRMIDSKFSLPRATQHLIDLYEN